MVSFRGVVLLSNTQIIMAAPDAQTLFAGKRLKWGPNADDSSKDKCIFCCLSCGLTCCDPFVDFSFMNNFSTDEGSNVTKWTMDSGMVRCFGVPFCCPSSIPCIFCAPKGTPCALVLHWVQDPSDPKKWIGTGSVCEKECCMALSNHDGDYFIVDDTHDGSKGKGLVMFGGNNPQTPPCYQGKEFPGRLVVRGAPGAAPDSKYMER